MAEPGDRDLRERFGALRREDAAEAPPFDALRAAARRRPAERSPLVRWAPAMVIVILAVAVALGVLRPRPAKEPLVNLASTRWQSPTDFLLRVPGAEYLETLPRLEWRTP